MSYIPPDTRVKPDFEVIRGMGSTLYVIEKDIKDIYNAITGTPEAVELGEPLRQINNMWVGSPTADTEAVYICNDSAVDNASVPTARIIGNTSSFTSSASTFKTDKILGLAWNEYDDNSSPITSPKRRDKLGVLVGEFVVKVKSDKFYTHADNVGLCYDSGSSSTVKASSMMAGYGVKRVGSDVVVISLPEGAGYAYFTIPPNRPAHDTSGVLTNTALHAIERSVVGKIINIQTEDGVEYVYIRMSL